MKIGLATAFILGAVTLSWRNFHRNDAISAECKEIEWSSAIQRGILQIHAQSFPQIVTPLDVYPRCRLAVIAAGAERTGSTLQTELARELLTARGITPTVFIWNFHLYELESGATVEHANETLQQLKNVTADIQMDDILIIKTHKFDSRLLQYCRNHIVLTTSRDPVAVARSVRHAGWANRPQDILPILLQALDSQRCWGPFSQYHQLYEEINLRQYAQHLDDIFSPALGESNLPPHVVSEIAIKYKAQEANPNVPGLKFNQTASDDINFTKAEEDFIRTVVSTHVQSKSNIGHYVRFIEG